MNHNQTQLDDETEVNAELIQQLNQGIAISQWIQFIGQLTEGIYLTKLVKLQPTSKGELNELIGQWIQTIGQGIETVGATTQVLTKEQSLLVEAKVQGIIGDTLQALGNAVQVVANKELLVEELRANLEHYMQ